MLWTAPTLRHQSAIGWLRRNEPLEGSRPWARLADRSRYREVGFSNPRRERRWRGGDAQAHHPSEAVGVLRGTVAVPCRHLGLSDRPSLEPPTSSAWPHREAAAAELRKSLFEAQKKRCPRRCPNLRSSHAAVDAICGDEV